MNIKKSVPTRSTHLALLLCLEFKTKILGYVEQALDEDILLAKENHKPKILNGKWNGKFDLFGHQPLLQAAARQIELHRGILLKQESAIYR